VEVIAGSLAGRAMTSTKAHDPDLPSSRTAQLHDMGGSHILGGMEYFFACPYCCEQISMVLDTSVKGQTYLEDCEVCCQPIEVRYIVEDGEVRHFEAAAA
jgi:Cysteine-rich CPXCG